MSFQVTINPTVPQGTESLKLGDDRIRAVAKALCNVLGFDGTATVGFVNPFTIADLAQGLVTVEGDAVDPLGIVTLQQLARGTGQLTTITSADGILYTGTPAPVLTAYASNALYILNNTGPANSGAGTMLNLGIGPAPLVRRDGSALDPGDIQAGNGVGGSVLLLVGYDGAKFRVLDFLGGTIPNNVILPTYNGLTAQLNQATTKAYVDGVVGGANTPMVVNMTTAQINLTANTASDIMTVTLTMPDDGSYLAWVDYTFYGSLSNSTPANSQAYGWLNDGTQKFAVGGYEKVGTGQEGFTVMASGMSPVAYIASSTVTFTVQAISNQGDGTAGKVQILTSPTGPPAGLPAARMTVTLVRTNT